MPRLPLSRVPLRPLLLSAILIALNALNGAATDFALGQEKKSAEKQESDRPYRMSKETTRLTGPLNSDGRLDLYRFLNERHGADVTPDNNAARFLLATLSDGHHDQFELVVFRRWIDYDSIPMGHPKITGVPQFVEENNCEHLTDQLYYRDKELSPNDQKLFEAYIAQNDEAIDAIVEATHLPKFHLAYFTIDEGIDAYQKTLDSEDNSKDEPTGSDTRNDNSKIEDSAFEHPVYGHTLHSWDPSGAFQTRALVRLVRSRAIHRIRRSEFELAWSDLLAIRRLGKLVGQGAMDMEALTASAISSMANESAMELLQTAVDTGQLNKLALARMVTQWGDDFSPFKMDHVVESSRHSTHEIYCLIAEDKFPYSVGLAVLLEGGQMSIADELVRDLTKQKRLDWNEGLRWSNTFFDKVLAIDDSNLPELKQPAERLAKFESLKKDVAKLEETFTTGQADFTGKQSPKDNAKMYCGMLLVHPAENLLTVQRVFWKRKRDEKLVSLTLRCLSHFQKHGQFPNDLTQLEQTDSVLLINPITGEPFQLVQKDESFIINNQESEIHNLLEFSTSGSGK